MKSIKSSEQLNEIFTALSKAQALIDNVVAGNKAYNFNYADLGDVIKAVREPFASHGLSVIQMPFSTVEENGVVRDGLATRICHESGQWIESEMLSPGGGQGKMALIQNLGSNITYMRRYMLAAMAGVAQVDDESELMGNSSSDKKARSAGTVDQGAVEKRDISEAGFNKMIDAILVGKYSAKSAENAYNLTQDQIARANNAQEEFKLNQGGQNAQNQM